MSDESDGRGAPARNQNATKHGLYADRENYYENFPNTDQDFIERMENSLAERYRKINGREPDMFAAQVLRAIAIDLEQLPDAYKYIKKQGLTQQRESIQEGTLLIEDVPNTLLETLRKQNESIIKRMEKLGLLNDPETKKANALGDAENVAELWDDEDNDVIDVDFDEV
jgi:hypothetical protein